MDVIITFIITIVLDQLSKYAVRETFILGESKTVINGFFDLTWIENDGAAFSSFSGETVLLTVFPAAVIVAGILVLIKHREWCRFLRISVAMITAGGLGNLIDRILKHSVTDMFSFSIFPPVFNVADIAVTAGCIMLLVYVIFIDGGKIEE